VTGGEGQVTGDDGRDGDERRDGLRMKDGKTICPLSFSPVTCHLSLYQFCFSGKRVIFAPNPQTVLSLRLLWAERKVWAT